jgi:hypothetical protein
MTSSRASQSTQTQNHSPQELMSAPMNSQSSTAQPTSSTDGHSCPYHSPILTMNPAYNSTDVSPMERFLGEGPGDQSSILVRHDTGELSLSKGCTCPVPQNFAVEKVA